MVVERHQLYRPDSPYVLYCRAGMVGEPSVLQMAPSGQPSILALLLQSAERLRGEQAEQERVDKRKQTVQLVRRRRRMSLSP